MFAVKLNQANYEYDVHSLVKAFYPQETVKVLTPETKEETTASILKESGGVSLEIQIEDAGATILLVQKTSAEGEENVEGSMKAEGGENVEGSMKAEGGENVEGSVKAEGGEKVEKHVKHQAEPVSCTKHFTWSHEENEGRFKDAFKRFLYRVLSEVTGKELPWGNLTGIRPTKLAYAMLEEGRNDAEIKGVLQKTHYVSEEKIELSIDIAKRERELLSKVHYEGGYSLYIGIPFCPTTCLYCSFTSYPIAGYRKMVESYVECVIKEMEYVSKAYSHKILDSVYVGGGTPTTLEPEELDRLLGKLKELFDFSQVKEFTVEAGRADSITREKLEVLKKHGVGRISINPQTMKQETLQMIGRRHTVEQVLEAYAMAREVGFENINMDLILGLPGEAEEDVQRTIDKVVELNPDSLTVHSLAIKRASRLSQWIAEHGIETLRNTDKTMEIAAAGAKMLGMEPYYLYRQKNMSGNFENVGYAKPGKYGLYNILIMEEKQTIVACGAGTITKRVFMDGRIERCDNVKDVALYVERIEEMIERKRELLENG